MEKEKKEKLLPLLIFLLIILVVAAGITALFTKRKIEIKVKNSFDLGKSFGEKGEYNLAKDFFQGIVKTHPRAPLAPASQYHLGLCYKKLKNWEQAEKEWQKLLTDYAKSDYADEAYYELGVLQLLKGNYKEAKEYYQKIIKKFPARNTAPHALCGIGELYEKEGLLLKAKEIYQKVITHYPAQKDISSLSQKKLGSVNIKLILSPYSTEGSTIYKVQSGDTLTKIAQKFNTTVELLKECNNLQSNLIKPNKRLKVSTGKYTIIISKSKNTLILLTEKGKVIKTYIVSTGLHNCTPTGEFKITSKIKNPTWYAEEGVYPPGSPENILGTRWLGISEPGYGIHGTNDPANLGKQITRGCIRMANEDVEEFFKLIPEGTMIIIKD